MPSNVLTSLQGRVLGTLFDSGIGDQGFYLTGGTALSEFYFQHRYSEDLDLFNRRSDLSESDLVQCRDIFTDGGLSIASQEVQPEFARFFVFLETVPGQQLKVEFARDAGCQLAPFLIRIVVDSLLDVCVNKVCAIFGRFPSDPKDFVDLYFILRETDYELDYLLTLARQKEAAFEHEDGPLGFATNLLDVSENRRLPRMVEPLTASELAAELRPLAEEIILRFGPRDR